MLHKHLVRSALFLALLLPAFSHAAKLNVVTSFSILDDMTREVGGERVTVTTLVGPDQDAHVYQPTPADAKRVGAAQVFIINGLGFEGWLSRLTQASGFKGLRIEATAGIKPLHSHDDDDHEHGHGHEHGANDPHAWHDLANAQRYVQNIAEGLSKADPAGKNYYTSRAAAYNARLAELDRWAKTQFAAIPASQRKVLTSHDAFAYLGKRYGITFIAPQGISTESEASAKQVAAIIRQVRKDNIRAVFVENLGDRKLLDQLSRETGATVGGKLYSDALSAANGPAATFAGLFRYNAETILKTLNGKPQP